jgi:hypothetical protein
MPLLNNPRVGRIQTWWPLEMDVQEPGITGSTESELQGTVGGVAIAEAPPRVRFSFDSEILQYAEKADRIAVRSISGNRIVAFVEIISPGNKLSGLAFRKFREKIQTLIENGIQILIVNLFPPGSFDPDGIPRGLQIESDSVVPAVTKDEPLSFVSLRVSDHISGFVELSATGRDVPTMPLFLNADRYINVLLNESYEAAWRSVPQPWRDIVAAGGT